MASPELGFLKDFAQGPLDKYRKDASFDWKKMAVFLEGEEMLRYKYTIFKTIEDDPIFCRGLETPSLEKQRELTFHRARRMRAYNFVPDEEIAVCPEKIRVHREALGMYDWALAFHVTINAEMFGSTLMKQGTRHMDIVMANRANEEFLINTPDFEATKIWVGGLGKLATHAILYAQLYTEDGKHHGLHSFVIPVRHPKTLKVYPGIMVGDIGEKIGLNGVDNGFAAFNQYRIPRELLLDRFGDVTPDGRYVSPFKDPKKRFGASLGALLSGRVNIVGMCVTNLKLCLTIAIRYSAVRRQFGPGDEEIPVLEYQLQQWRLFPYLAATYVHEHFGQILFQFDHDFQALGEDFTEKQIAIGRELHSLSCGGKPVAGWLARDAIQECREACGGHGYFKVNRFGEIRNDHDPNNTYEGDNNVILQQTSNYLLSLAEDAFQGKEIRSELGSANVLSHLPERLQTQFSATTLQDCLNPQVALDAYKWLVCHFLKESHRRLSEQTAEGKDPFTARNDSQAYYCRSLALAYTEHTVLERFMQSITDQATPQELCPVLHRLAALYGLWSVEKHLATLYQGGYVSGGDAPRIIREAILVLCQQLKPDAVSLVDAIAPPDFILNSPIGASDGQIYKNLYGAMLQGSKTLERASYWQDAVTPPPPLPRAKL